MTYFNAVTILHVKDLDASIDFYVNTLALEQDFKIDDYAGLKKDDIAIHITSNVRREKYIGKGHLYIITDEIDNLYDHFRSKGVTITSPPQNYFYGMREFVIEDPDGNTISFGSEVNS